MNMNREVLEEEAKAIQERAKIVQAGLQTMKNLQKCLVHGHRFDLHVEQDEFYEILQMGVRCSVCGAETELFENIALEMPDDEMKVGGLATLGLDEIDVEEPEEEEEPEKKPTPYDGYNPMERQTQEGNGPYRVDTKRFLRQEE
jgi:predicted peroxiredoxin